MTLGGHADMKDADNHDLVSMQAIENDVRLIYDAAVGRSEFGATPPGPWLCGERAELAMQTVDISDHLPVAPGAERVRRDIDDICLGSGRKDDPCHVLCTLAHQGTGL